MRTPHKRLGGRVLVGLFITAIVPTAVAQATATTRPATCLAKEKRADQLKPQTICPIMGGKIDKKVFIDVAGYRIYACCKPCLDKIKANPAKAVATLKTKGETPELRLVVCPKCGEIKGTGNCCKPGATKCPKCKLDKGSPGCCKDLKPDLVICPKCGEIKETDACCKPGATKCPKCKLDKDSPGCCKDLKSDAVICPKCGELKGTANCCKPDATKCPKCGLNKGSPGCCKDLQQDAVICPKCGEIKGAAHCCKPDATKCPKCGLNKGSPGCCKIGAYIGCGIGKRADTPGPDMAKPPLRAKE